MVFSNGLFTALSLIVLCGDLVASAPLVTIDAGSNPFATRSSNKEIAGYAVELLSMAFFLVVILIAVSSTHTLDETRRKFHYIIVVLTLVTLVSYLAMFTKYPIYGASSDATEGLSYVPRFMAWMVTFPLQGALLCGLARPDGTTGAIVPLSLFLFALCTYRGSLQVKTTVKALWLLFGLVFTVPVVAALKGRLVESVRSVGPKATLAYSQVSYFTWRVWAGYVVVYLLCTVAGWVPGYAEVLLYGVLDIYCIGGVSLVLLFSKGALMEATGH